MVTDQLQLSSHWGISRFLTQGGYQVLPLAGGANKINPVERGRTGDRNMPQEPYNIGELLLFTKLRVMIHNKTAN